MAIAGRSRGEFVVRHRQQARPGAWNYAAWALLYAAFVAYSSLVVGPSGLHFVALDPAEAWKSFRATQFFENGSDQRADWIANLLLTIPLGFLASGAAASLRRGTSRALGIACALLLCLIFVLAVKYAQLFFPPRTVSLNYIVAQVVGVCIGVAAYPPIRTRMQAFAALDDRARLKLLLDLAIVALVAFALFPFDFALSAADLRAHFGDLPQDLTALPWSGRSAGLRLVLATAVVASTVPLGMRLAVRRDHPGMGRIVLTGSAWMVVLLLVTALVLSATASLATLALRAVGIAAGASAQHWLSSQDMARWRQVLARLVPWLVLPYLLLLAYVQDLLQRHWQTPGQALATLDPRAILPLWHYYIVSKAHAAQDIAAHAVMYAPIGVMVWLCHPHRQHSAWTVGLLAGLVALLVEMARGLQPGRELDPDAVIIAALSAALALRASPVVWRLLGSVAANPEPAPQPPRTEVAGGFARAQRAAFEQITGQRRSTTEARGIPLSVRISLAAACGAGVAILAMRYPLGPLYPIVAAAGWIALLWWRPVLWLVMLPALLPSVDLAPWTGWLVTSEADIAVLATIGVLLLRDPPARVDVWPEGAARFALTLATLACLIGVVRGMLLPYAVPGGSDNPYLEPLNSLRGAKPFIEALALLPFLLARQRVRRDAVAWFGRGMLVGLSLIGIAAILERAAFVGVFDMHSDYRVVATFSSMHIGGGHIGAFIALALPFLFVALNQPNPRTLLALTAVIAIGGYALVVTFARTAYAAALVAVVATSFAWGIAQLGQGRRAAAIVGAVLPVLLIAAVGIGLLTPYMTSRLGETSQDFATRERNWTQGLGIDRQDRLSFLLGMGAGTYPRMVASSPFATETPGNYVVNDDGGQRYLKLSAGPGFYFGQKVQVTAGSDYALTLDARTEGDATLQVGLCEKLLLYSLDCRAATFKPGRAWARMMASLQAPTASGLLPAPIELWLATDDASPLDVTRVRLVGPDGGNAVVNGDFANGTARWLFTSDTHLDWRIKNLYLATWFDGGLLGLLAVVVLGATAMAEAGRAVARGDRWGAPIIGGLIALLISGVFDNVLEAPRLACLYYLVILLGLIIGGRSRSTARFSVTKAA